MRIYSIFTSIDGEVNGWGQGGFSTFIRFAGCNLRCKYCDTIYAQGGFSGKEMSVTEILVRIESRGCKKLTITGGEPLFQLPGLEELVHYLSRYDITLETNGSFFVPNWLSGRNIVMDYKLESSGQTVKMNLDNFKGLKKTDFVKFVVKDRVDYDQAKKVMEKVGGYSPVKFAFSPCYETMEGKKLVDWLIEDKLFDCIVNVQIHKCLGLVEDK